MSEFVILLSSFLWALLFSSLANSTEPMNLYQSCDGDSTFNISFLDNTNNAVVVVESNQIQIDAKYETVGDVFTFYLEKPKALGRGGMMLDWGSFNKDKKIFTLKKNKNSYNVKWLGFYNKETGKYDYNMRYDSGDYSSWSMSYCDFY